MRAMQTSTRSAPTEPGKTRGVWMFNKPCPRIKLCCQFALALLLLGSVPVKAQVAITPSTPPVVSQGTTFKFSANTSVTSSCPGCAGTVDADGTYHAPQSVKGQQSYGGFQVLPNNH